MGSQQPAESAASGVRVPARPDPASWGVAADDWYRVLSENADDVVLFVGTDNRIAWVAPRITAALGWSPDDLLDTPLAAWVLADDHDRLLRLHAATVMQGVMSAGHGAEMRLRHRDGGARWMTLRVVPVASAVGEAAGAIVTMRDIGEVVAAREALRASEERATSIVAASPDGIVIADAVGTIRFASPNAVAMFGLPDADAALGANALDFIVVEDRGRAAGALASAAATGILPLSVYTGERADGTALEVEVNGVRLGADELVFSIRDVSERRRSERALEAVRAELVEAQRLGHVGSWTWRLPGRTLEWSDGMYAIYGLDPVLSSPEDGLATDRYAPGTSERIRLAIERTLETGEPYVEPMEIIRPDGSTRHAIGRGEVLRDAQGVALGVRGVVIDMTEQWEAEEELRRAKAALEEAQRVSQTGSFTVDLPEGRGTWSDELNRIYGRPPGSPAPSADELDAMLPGGAHVFRDATGHTMATGTVAEGFEHAYRRPDGSTGWLLTRGRLELTPDGVPARIHGTETEVTEIHEAREAIRASAALQRSVFEALADGIVVQDASGRITAANPAARRILGLRTDEITGRTSFNTAWDAISEDGRPLSGDRHPAMVALATGESARDVRMGLAHPDGRRIWISVNAEPLRDDDGRITGSVASFTDITAQREMEQLLQRAQRLEAVGQLAGGIAHDFNNLLAAVRGYCELARDELPADSPIRSDIAEALTAVDRAARLTRQLLAFSGRQPLRPELVDPVASIRSLEPVFRDLMGDAITVEVTAGMQVRRVRVDPGKLEQALLSLAENALDAMPAGGRFAISVDDTDGETDARADDGAGAGAPAGDSGEPQWIRITVADTGTGMDEATRLRAFEPFFTTKPIGQGSGMGLAYVYGVVEQSGGRIGVTSEPGQGTTFTIDLPRVREDEGVAGPSLASRPQDAARRVLLVEDEPNVRAVTARLLRDLGYTVLEAPAPDTVLALDDEEMAAVDVLVTDVVMPGMSGVRLADLVEERRSSPVRVVLMSGYAPDTGMEQRLRRPGSAFVAKPFTRATLADAVRRVLAEDEPTDLPTDRR